MTTTATMALVTASANFTIPGCQDYAGPASNMVTLPDGRMLKFWVCAELHPAPGCEDGTEPRTLTESELADIGVHLEHEDTILNLAPVLGVQEDDIGEKTDDELTPEQLERQTKGSW